MLLVSIAPNLRNESGHDANYARAVTEAVASVAWRHKVLIPIDCVVQNRPQNWQIALPVKRGNSPVGRIRYWLRLARSVEHSIAELLNQDDPHTAAVLMESFTIGQLAAALIGLSRLRSRPRHFCLLYRNDSDVRRPFDLAHKLLLRIVEQTSLCNITLFSDSRTLADFLENVLNHAVFTLPIPHTSAVSETEIPNALTKELLCWWPGAPRPEKGLSAIRQFATLRSSRTIATLMVSKHAGLTETTNNQNNSVRIELLADPLPEHEYASVMHRSTVVLLPYDRRVYRKATSGIFVEAVCAGKIPLVTSGTWMAHELSRFGLDRLIANWTSMHLLDEINDIMNDEPTVTRLREMRDHYVAYHNSQQYGRLFRDYLRDEHIHA